MMPSRLDDARYRCLLFWHISNSVMTSLCPTVGISGPQRGCCSSAGPLDVVGRVAARDGDGFEPLATFVAELALVLGHFSIRTVAPSIRRQLKNTHAHTKHGCIIIGSTTLAVDYDYLLVCWFRNMLSGGRHNDLAVRRTGL